MKFEELSAQEQKKILEITSNLDSSDSDDRRWAIYDLEDYDSEAIMPYIVRGILDENRAVREAASELLENVPVHICADDLVPLLGSERIEVRNIVAAIFVKYGIDAVDPLMSALFNENEDVRKFGADILGLAGKDNAVESLCKVALNDEVANVSVSAVEALGKIGSPLALPSLHEILEGKRGMRVEAAEAIGLIGSDESASILGEYIHEDDPILQYAVFEALGNVGNTETIQVLKPFLQNTPALLQEQVCRTILTIGQKNRMNVLQDENGFIDILMEFLKKDIADIVSLAINQLGFKTRIEGLDKFINVAHELPSNLLVALINSIKQTHDNAKPLIILADSKDEWVAYTAIESLSNFSKEEVGYKLMDILRTSSGLPVLAAIKTAARIELEEAIPIIQFLANSEDDDIRSTAIRILDTSKE